MRVRRPLWPYNALYGRKNQSFIVSEQSTRKSWELTRCTYSSKDNAK